MIETKLDEKRAQRFRLQTWRNHHQTGHGKHFQPLSEFRSYPQDELV